MAVIAADKMRVAWQAHIVPQFSRIERTRERRRALSAAKVTIGRAACFIGQQAVQLHGGMGMSDELVVSHWFKRLTAIELMFGDTDTHLQQFIEISAQS